MSCIMYPPIAERRILGSSTRSCRIQQPTSSLKDCQMDMVRQRGPTDYEEKREYNISRREWHERASGRLRYSYRGRSPHYIALLLNPKDQKYLDYDMNLEIVKNSPKISSPIWNPILNKNPDEVPVMPKPNPPIILMNEYRDMISTGFYGKNLLDFSAYFKILLSDRMMKKGSS